MYPVPDPDPYYFSKIRKNFRKKHFLIFDKIFFSIATKKLVQIGTGTRPVTNWPLVSGSVILDYGSAYPDPKEIFTVSQHCMEREVSSYMIKCTNI
jgi:hypothetical protein